MPGIGGLEMLAEIKRVNPDIAVVMMTSTLEPAVAERARRRRRRLPQEAVLSG